MSRRRTALHHGKRVATEQRDLMRDLMRDPLHLPEILILHAQAKLSPRSVEWADRAAGDPSTALRDARREARTAARIDGAISGTPFLIALVPAYVAALWEQARLALRTAAVSGRDPSSIETAAELLVVRGVHADQAAALSALEAARNGDRARAPKGFSGRFRALYDLAIRILLFAAFINPPGDERPSWARRIISFTVASAIWIFTVIFPLAFMALMAWSCESAARRTAELTAESWLPELDPPAPETIGQKVARTAAITLLGIIPVSIVALGVVRPTGLTTGLAAVVGLCEALILALAISRRGSFAREYGGA